MRQHWRIWANSTCPTRTYKESYDVLFKFITNREANVNKLTTRLIIITGSDSVIIYQTYRLKIDSYKETEWLDIFHIKIKRCNDFV